MSEEDVERRAQILRAAFEVFAHKGFKEATIRGIARAAGLQSPSLIYWYFPTKEDLFQAAVAEQSLLLRMALDPTPRLDERPEEVLPLLAYAYLNFVRQPEMQRVVRLLIGEAIRRPEIAEMIGQRLMLRVLEFLRRYLTRQIELGRLRPHDVRASARAFMGLLVPVALGHILLPDLLADGLTGEEHVQNAIAIFLEGLRSSTAGPSPSG